MRGFYYEFARLAIRLLVAIYRIQLAAHTSAHPNESQTVKDGEAWLEKYK